MGLSTAQAFGYRTGPLNAQGANGGPQGLLNQPFFISMNSSIHFLLPQSEQPGGLVSPGDGGFTPSIFDPFSAWGNLAAQDPRAAVARGQALFNSLPISITGVAGINDDVAAGGLVAAFPRSRARVEPVTTRRMSAIIPSRPPLDIGTGDPNSSNASANLGGLDITYLVDPEMPTKPV